MSSLGESIREVQALRAMIAQAEHDQSTGSGRGGGAGASAADRFAARTRVGVMRHDDAHLAARLRARACEGDPSLARRFDRLLLLVDEVVVLELEARLDPADRMRAAMARQAAGELEAEVAALEERVRALPPRPAVPVPALRLVDQAG